MCFHMKTPKVPKPVPPPSPPSKQAADLEAENTRRMLAMRQSAAASVKTGQLGASDYGNNSQTPGLGDQKTSSVLGSG